MMDVHYIPRSQLVARLTDGWALIPGYEYRNGEYAVLMYEPERKTRRSAKTIRLLAQKFEPRPRGWSNRSTAASSRNLTPSGRWVRE